MRFRDDIDPAKTWVWSDPHFGGSKNMTQFANRPEDAEQLLLERVAQAVGPDDTLLCLGDLVYSNNSWFQHMQAKHITGERKLLIAGNHDRGRNSFYRKCGFKFASPFKLKWGDWTVSFAHYPWGPPQRNEFGPMPDKHLRVHGHIHAKGYTRAAFVPYLRNHVNISCEQTDYSPVNLALLLSAVIDGHYPQADPLPDPEYVEKESHHAA